MIERPVKIHDYFTRRRCDEPKCCGDLQRTIVKFGERLDPEVIQKACENAHKADVLLIVGSSLRVNPAAKIPEIVQKNGGKIIIINLQKTPLHD